MDFIQTLDPSKLVLAGTGLSFLISLGVSPSYNFPLFLFGCYAQETTEAAQSLQTFTDLLGASVLFDTVWMIKNHQHGFFKFLNICLLLLKLPTFLAFANAVRQRGGQLGLGSNNLSGPTLWSMPGGFTSNAREGYQTVDDDTFVRNARPAPASQRPAPPTEQTAPGAYQTV
ncbi:unnamed protein product [Cyclocybe aegerita]|uniref:Uncharacterized protein n=1 Tax=Cyclocybe aegerita TaxID=1973307 RepID=A0A8S0XLW6_CYCAE|nr:unnamed protein product [Cyclocybe aegerita]